MGKLDESIVRLVQALPTLKQALPSTNTKKLGDEAEIQFEDVIVIFKVELVNNNLQWMFKQRKR